MIKGKYFLIGLLALTLGSCAKDDVQPKQLSDVPRLGQPMSYPPLSDGSDVEAACPINWPDIIKDIIKWPWPWPCPKPNPTPQPPAPNPTPQPPAPNPTPQPPAPNPIPQPPAPNPTPQPPAPNPTPQPPAPNPTPQPPAPNPTPQPPAPNPTPQPPAPNPTPQPPSGDFASEILRLVNASRTAGVRCGDRSMPAVGAVTYSAKLAQAALGHSQDMANRKYFNNLSPDGHGPGKRIQATGYKAYIWAENIAAGVADPKVVHTMWMDSPGHCRSIMNAHLKEMGIGYAQGSTDQYQNLWTQVFGASR